MCQFYRIIYDSKISLQSFCWKGPGTRYCAWGRVPGWGGGALEYQFRQTCLKSFKWSSTCPVPRTTVVSGSFTL